LIFDPESSLRRCGFEAICSLLSKFDARRSANSEE